jgi:uncharacterized protein YlxW (UPF0749 family)
MGETKPNETKPKKMVRRSVAVALGIICIVLVVVGLVGTVTYVMPMINDKDDTISSLNLKISQLNTNNTNLQDQINQLQTWLNGNITSFTSQTNYLNSQITNLQNHITNLQNHITSLQDGITNLQYEITSLQMEIANLQTIINTLENQTQPPRPAITYVSPIRTVNNQTIDIIGFGFGSMPQTTNVGDGSVDMPNFKISEGDGSGWGSNWNAGCTDQNDLIGVYLLSWTDTKIVIGGFGSYLGQLNHGSQNCYFVQGDNITITVNNLTWTTILQPP